MSSLKIIGSESVVRLAQVSNDSVMRIKNPALPGVARNTSSISSEISRLPPPPKELSKPASPVHTLPEWLSIAPDRSNRAALKSTDSSAPAPRLSPQSPIDPEHRAKLSEALQLLARSPQATELFNWIDKASQRREIVVTTAEIAHPGIASMRKVSQSVLMNGVEFDFRSPQMTVLDRGYVQRKSAAEIALELNRILRRAGYEMRPGDQYPLLELGARSKIPFEYELRNRKNQDDLAEHLQVPLESEALTYAIVVRQDLIDAGAWKGTGKDKFFAGLEKISPDLLPWFKEFKMGAELRTVGEIVDQLEQIRALGYLEGEGNSLASAEARALMGEMAYALRHQQISMSDVVNELKRPHYRTLIDDSADAKNNAHERDRVLGREIVKQELMQFLQQKN